MPCPRVRVLITIGVLASGVEKDGLEGLPNTNFGLVVAQLTLSMNKKTPKLAW